MSHAARRLQERYGSVIDGRSSQVSPRTLLRVIRAGNASEILMKCGGDASARAFDVPITFQDGTRIKIRCVVSLDLNKVITVLPTEMPTQQLARKDRERKRAMFKIMERAGDADDEAMAPVEVDEAAREKLEQERKSAKATFGDALCAGR
jgi:hypothetical protein